MKITNIIAIVMAVSGVLVVLGALLNISNVVAIFTGVVGKQDGDWYGIVALLLGLAIVAIFVYAYRLSMWDWKIRGALIALSGVIFLVSAIGMAENFTMNFDLDTYTWSRGSGNSEEILRLVTGVITAIDIDFVVVMMLIGSIGVAAAALWGAFRWESAKVEESRNDEIRGLFDELPPQGVQAGMNYLEELDRHYNDDPSQAGAGGQPGAVQTPSDSTARPTATPKSAGTAEPSPGRRRCPRCWAEVKPHWQVCAYCGAGN